MKLRNIKPSFGGITLRTFTLLSQIELRWVYNQIMCGRYQLGLAGKNKLFGYRFKVDEQQALQLKDNFNVAPSQEMPVIVKHSPNTIRMMNWGLIPSWSKDGKGLVINARSESVAETRSLGPKASGTPSSSRHRGTGRCRHRSV